MNLYDINKFKPGKWILRFPISMARIDNAQSPKAYFEDYIPYITPSKILTATIGVNFCYGERLYMRSDEPANILKKKYTWAISKHKNESIKYIYKPHINLWKSSKDATYYVPYAFAFDTWSSLYFGSERDFGSDFGEILKIYNNDQLFQKYLKEDCDACGKEVTENQIMFFLEEHLLMYFVAKRKIQLKNDYIPGHDRVLLCYPWKPLKHQIYIMQQNFFKLSDDKNIYANSRYDLEQKKIYDMSKIDLGIYIYTK